MYSRSSWFGFVIAKRDELLKCKGQARSLSLDLYVSGKRWKIKMGNGVLRHLHMLYTLLSSIT